MNAHRCCQPCIMNLNARNSNYDQQPSPLLMDSEIIHEQAKSPLYLSCIHISMNRINAITVSISRACQDIPELGEILRGITKNRALTCELRNGCFDDLKRRVARL